MQGQRDIGGTQMAHPARPEESSQNPCYNSKSTAQLTSDNMRQLQPELTKSRVSVSTVSRNINVVCSRLFVCIYVQMFTTDCTVLSQ